MPRACSAPVVVVGIAATGLAFGAALAAVLRYVYERIAGSRL